MVSSWFGVDEGRPIFKSLISSAGHLMRGSSACLADLGCRAEVRTEVPQAARAHSLGGPDPHRRKAPHRLTTPPLHREYCCCTPILYLPGVRLCHPRQTRDGRKHWSAPSALDFLSLAIAELEFQHHALESAASLRASSSCSSRRTLITAHGLQRRAAEKAIPLSLRSAYAGTRRGMSHFPALEQKHVVGHVVSSRRRVSFRCLQVRD